ncbi:PQQ-dependent dehydrogenase, methanol/ethanol family [Nitrosococcus halophilus Nc 4]|uniref:PQQ-dependent dehydrogenase, methanol/ethanol family n=1 Tax=Nitrosococcus halophilus (strain Nc4) TaxID=472759 RepID=D5C3H1_NITHN|nr:methanol/ethanol family PQQ-dependent dehydrogenase [Nitrosococcus halophilus]ADE16878.1 PQQ-dependent dehydrogenase, methanol/ethanol family [Nitrosococcus halophilus Nc 4]
MKLRTVSLAILALIMSGMELAAADELLEMQKNSDNWIMPAGTYDNQRYSKLDQINTDNAQDLRVAWTFSTGVLRGHEGNPLVIDGTMYVHTPFPNKVFALDLDEDGAIKWKYEPVQNYEETVPVMCCDTINRGLAYGDGKIFLAQADTTLVALDAKTGKVVWSVKRDDPKQGATSTGAPHVFKDKVLVGISGGEFGVRGYLEAYDVNSGERIWKAYSTGPDEEMLIDPEKTTHLLKPVGKNSSLESWEGEQWKIGGGTTWGWFAYDPELNLVYYGTANPGTWNPVQRPGDNRWSMTIFARDLDTGVAKWAYQMTPHDEWDYDGVNEMVLVDQKIDGEERKLLVHLDRNGFGYTLDRVTGELLVAEKFDPVVNWATHVDMETGRPQVDPRYSTHQNGQDVNTTNICPAALGSKDQQPVAFSPRTGLFYVPANHVCMNYEPFEVSYTAGQPYVGATLTMFPGGKVSGDGSTHLGRFFAWDARKGKVVWEIPERFSVWSGTLATAGDIVAYGTLEGYLKVVDAKSGRELYRFKTPSGIIGNVMTYQHKGKQYLAVLSGLGGWAGIGMAAGLQGETEGLGAVGAYRSLEDWTNLGGTLTVFTLP